MAYNVFFQYNNVGKPYFLIKSFTDGKIAAKGIIHFDFSALQDGIPYNVDAFIEKIDSYLKNKDITRGSALFLLNTNEQFKISTTMPNINERKMKKLYDNELSLKIPNIDDFDRFSSYNDLSSGRVYYEFLLHKRFGQFAKELCQKLGFASYDYDLYSNFLMKNADMSNTSSNFVYYYEENDITSCLTIIDGKLCSYFSFPSDSKSYNLSIAAAVDNHVHENEKIRISNIVTNCDIPALSALKPVINQYIISTK